MAETEAKTALQQLSQPTPIAQFSADDTSQTISLTAPRDLQERLKLIDKRIREINKQAHNDSPPASP